MDGAEALRIARDSANRALAIDPDDGDALVVIGEARRVLDHDPAGARAAFEKVLALNPSSEAAHRYYAWFLGVRQARCRCDRRRRPRLQPRSAVHRDADVGRRRPLPRARLRGRAGPQPPRAGDGAGLGSRDALGRRRARPARTRRGGRRHVRRGAGAGAVHGGARRQRLRPGRGGQRRPRPRHRAAPRARRQGPRRVAAITSPRCTPRSATPRRRSRSSNAPAPAGDPWLDAVGVDPRFAALHGDDRLHAIRARLRLDLTRASATCARG